MGEVEGDVMLEYGRLYQTHVQSRWIMFMQSKNGNCSIR